jgi:hypothetical protein
VYVYHLPLLFQADLLITLIKKLLPSLTNIIINHLVLSLRAFSNHTVQCSGRVPSNTTTPSLGALDFAENRFLGNIGAPLDYNQWDDADEIENEVEQGIGDIEWEIPATMVDPLTTLVPVVSLYLYLLSIYLLTTSGTTDI